MQNLIQLYRCDEEYTTYISLHNYLSYLISDNKTSIRYKIIVFDRNGAKISDHTIVLQPFQVLHCSLSSLFKCSLDEYGVYTVQCDYEAPAVKKMLGWNSPQFMTIFVPKDDKNSPQLIHSHKYMNMFTPPKRKNKRLSPIIENGEGLANISYFIINSCRGAVSGNIKLPWVSKKFQLKALSTVRLDFDVVNNFDFSMELELDRAINHRKPIVFRRFKSGLLTASHS